MLDRIRSLWDINNSFFEFGRKLLWVFLMNILFVITCIPIITIGASVTAMNSVFIKIINEKDFSLVKDYFTAFKENFIQSTIVWVIVAAVGFVLYVDVFYWASYGIQDGLYGYFMLIFSAIVSAFFLMMTHTVFPLMARFDMGYKELLTNTFFITAKHFLYALEAVILSILIIGVSFYMILTGKMLIMIYMVLLCFGLNGLVQSYIYRRVLNRYSEEYVEMVKRLQKEMEEDETYQ